MVQVLHNSMSNKQTSTIITLCVVLLGLHLMLHLLIIYSVLICWVIHFRLLIQWLDLILHNLIYYIGDKDNVQIVHIIIYNDNQNVMMYVQLVMLMIMFTNIVYHVAIHVIHVILMGLLVQIVQLVWTECYQMVLVIVFKVIMMSEIIIILVNYVIIHVKLAFLTVSIVQLAMLLET